MIKKLKGLEQEFYFSIPNPSSSPHNKETRFHYNIKLREVRVTINPSQVFGGVSIHQLKSKVKQNKVALKINPYLNNLSFTALTDS